MRQARPKTGDQPSLLERRGLGLTIGEYKIVHLLAKSAGRYITYRSIYDRLTYEGFIAGVGNTGYWSNVRSAITRIRNKFRACDPAFVEIENYTAFGYCWGSPAGDPKAGGPGWEAD